MSNGPGGTRTGAANGSGGGVVAEGVAECVAQSADESQIDPRLQEVINQWSKLDDAARGQICTIVEENGGGAIADES